MDNQNNAIVNIPKCLDGKFYTILNFDEIINVNSNVKAMCVTCEEKKKENRIISGAINSTSNFRLHMKVSTYLKYGNFMSIILTNL